MRAVDSQDLGAIDLQADRGSISAWCGLQTPERIVAIKNQVDAGVEIDITDGTITGTSGRHWAGSLPMKWLTVVVSGLSGWIWTFGL